MLLNTDRLNINDPENWQLKIVSTKVSQRIEPNSHKPIPIYDLGLTLTNFYLLAEVTTSKKQTTWEYGGTIYPSHPVNGFFVKQKGIGLKLDETLIVNTQPLGDSYRLFYLPPRWFKDSTIKIWEYQGSIANPLETKLDGIETRINELL
jgi:hypothetical protein